MPDTIDDEIWEVVHDLFAGDGFKRFVRVATLTPNTGGMIITFDLDANALTAAVREAFSSMDQLQGATVTSREAELKEALEDMAFQFAYRSVRGGHLILTTGGLSALEQAFHLLGWHDDMHAVPELECQQEGCHREATCGMPTHDGYKRLCGEHFSEIERVKSGKAG